MSWAEEELKNTDLGDRRRTQRWVQIVEGVTEGFLQRSAISSKALLYKGFRVVYSY